MLIQEQIQYIENALEIKLSPCESTYDGEEDEVGDMSNFDICDSDIEKLYFFLRNVEDKGGNL